ncbi:hypothetical protein XELAEV_18031417mg [Xenopus laevis]|nr:hypothetical protein XELAEV_18031417mg [Xenopus laevis]
MQALEQRRKSVRDIEDILSHHTLQQYLYKPRRQQKHLYSRHEVTVDEDEKQAKEIFQRTMKKRLESFKTTKFGRKHVKKINKNYKKDFGQRRSSTMTMLPNGNISNNMTVHDIETYDEEKTMEYDPEMNNCITFFASLADSKGQIDTGLGIDNPVFSANEEENISLNFAPWFSSEDAVAPSQRARVQIPYSPNNFRRLTPLRISNKSVDSFLTADIAEEQPRSFLPESTNM